MTNLTHTSVMVSEVLDSLTIASSDVVLDATIGGAGHLRAMAGMLGSEGTIIGIDLDPDALTRAQVVTRDLPVQTILEQNNFRNISAILEKHSIAHIDKALFDLGWSGFQLAHKGFSFRNDEELDMRYGTEGISAQDIVNTYDEKKLADIIYTYGEERHSRAIAKAIVAQRKISAIFSTGELAECISRAVPAFYRNGRLHPATKTFQALRIETNDEINALTVGIYSALNYLSEGGVCAVITFHSIEDRAVKNLFKQAVAEGRGRVLHKKPLQPTRAEILANPRARSAKLRAFVREVQARGGEQADS